MAAKKEDTKEALNKPLTVDFKSSRPVPTWVREVIETHLAIEAEDAKSANSLGFMARALVIATMPYKDPKADVFKRKNGDFSLRIVAGYEGGVPFGIYPRLLMGWVTTEAVRKQTPVIELGDSLATFLRDVLDLKGRSGGITGNTNRVSEQVKRLFGSLITAQYSGTQEKKGFVLKNVLIAQDLQLSDAEMKRMDGDGVKEKELWIPQAEDEVGQWQSKVRLTDSFFNECITSPVPMDLRAYKALRAAGPMAMDIYTWASYRVSYMQNKSRPIPWESLMMQFGSSYGSNAITESAIKQAVLDFKRGFLKSLEAVSIVYPELKFELSKQGLILLPSPPHVAKLDYQKTLF